MKSFSEFVTQCYAEASATVDYTIRDNKPKTDTQQSSPLRKTTKAVSPLDKPPQPPTATQQTEKPRTRTDLRTKRPLGPVGLGEEVVMYKGKRITVGKHDKTPDSSFDARELALGIKTEKEHTGDVKTAKSIAKDHLSEVPDYYSKLKKVEKRKTTATEELVMERGEDSKGYKRSTEQGAGLTAKGAKHFGVQTAVTGKVEPGSKAAKRRKSFCARMSGMKGPMKDEKGRPTRKAMSLRRWRCR
jgi:hypothetical protein